MSEREGKIRKSEVVRKSVPQTPDVSMSVPDVDQSNLVELQRYLGNQGVQRLMAQRKLEGTSGTFIQTKLDVGPAGDQYEQEADQVAKAVVNTPDAAVQRVGEEEEMQMKRVQREGQEEELAMKRVQRAGEEEEMQMKRIQRVGEEEEMQMKPIQRAGEEEELQMQRIQRVGEEEEMQMKPIQRAGEEEELAMKRIQRASSEAGFEVDGDIEQSIQAQRGNGQALPDTTRNFMESRFGADFSGVKVHDNPESDSLNQSLSARAFTLGNDVFFRSNEYKPDSQDGKELLAHELTHVVQQGGAQAKRDDSE